MRLRAAIALLVTWAALLAAQAAPAAGAGLPFQLPSWAPAQLRALVPGVLAPRPQPSHQRRNPFAVSFKLHAKGGYEVAVIGTENRVVLEVGRKHTSAITAYVVPGVVTRKRLVGDFGAFGRISMRFRPPTRGRGSDPHTVCKSHHRVLRRHGVFRGSLRFDGEDGYVSLRAHRVAGEVTSVGRPCRSRRAGPLLPIASRPKEPRDLGPEPRFFFAGWRHAIDAANLVALEIFGIKLFLASSEHSEGRLAIVRLAFALGFKPRNFTLNDQITRATLSPPAPFHGTGTYTAAPDGTKTWEGPLSVNFPGAPRFALTGPPFEPLVEAGFEHSLSAAQLLDR
jgi:hypothetical protein